jgi:hypothetical protein
VGTTPGVTLAHDAPAKSLLLSDLRSDRGMEWVPDTAWLSKIAIDAEASELDFDLAIDASGQGTPSRVAAGLELAPVPVAPSRNVDIARLMIGFGAVGFGVLSVVWLLTRRPAGPSLSR